MNLELSDKQAALLERELRDIVENDRYLFSPRIRTLRAILDKLRPQPRPEPLPPPRYYEPPRKGRYGAKIGANRHLISVESGR
jgi:hypothetical protein